MIEKFLKHMVSKLINDVREFEKEEENTRREIEEFRKKMAEWSKKRRFKREG